MNKFLFISLLALVVSSFGCADTNAQGQKKATMEVEITQETATFKWANATTHDFGEVPQGTPVTHSFEFVNTGKEALTISKVKPSCGCTAVDYSKDAIAPGATGFVKAQYNAAKAGGFVKSVTVTSNANEGKPIVLKLRGVVEKSETTDEAATTPAPAADEATKARK